MGLLRNGKVSIVITNSVLRYTYHKNASIDGLITHGEVELPKGTIKDGLVINRTSLLEIVNQLVRQNKWKRKKLYFCVPDDTVVIRQIQIPVSLSKEEAVGYVKTQIGTSFYLPFGNPAIAIEFLDADEENREILLFAYPDEKITAFKEIFEEVGLKPVVADLTSLSIYRFYRSYFINKPDENDHVLLINWNRDALLLTAFHQHKAVFTRYMKIEVGEDGTEIKQINEDMAIQLIHKFMIEIHRIIDFYHYSISQGESRINMIFLSGDFPFLPTVKNALSEAETIPIHSFEEGALQIRYIDVVGLALKRGEQ